MPADPSLPESNAPWPPVADPRPGDPWAQPPDPPGAHGEPELGSGPAPGWATGGDLEALVRGEAFGNQLPTPSRRSRRAPRIVRRAGIGIGLIALAALLFTGGAVADRSGALGGPSAQPADPDPTQLALIRQAWNLLRTQYVGAADVDPTQMAYGAITGMTQAIGDVGHTSFLTPADRKANQAELSGTYVGIGVELDLKDGVPVINGIIHGGPSEAAGLQPGDRITAVDGKSTQDEALETIASQVRGTAGTAVVLTIDRPGHPAPLTFRLVRTRITVPPVGSAMIPGTTLGMIRVEQFSTGAGDEFAKELKALLASHPSGLVLDLRGNPGGFVSQAVDIASQFLTSGDVYITRDASGKETPAAVKPNGLAPTIPLVVLVDNGTASSAEIVAGALADAARARLVGTTTFGTGTVVAEYPLADGSALRIGTVEWLTPKRRPIWRHGITPDITVELPAAVRPVTPDDLARLGATGVASTTDVQLKRAIELLTKP